jgi:hypothetical protein
MPPNHLAPPRRRSTLVQLWLHEHLRVYGDRLVELADLRQLQACLHELLRSRFDWRQDFEELFASPAVFGEPRRTLSSQLAVEQSCFPRLVLAS